MPVKGEGRAASPRWHPWGGGLSWTAFPDETMRRTSHAVQTRDGVWIVEPVDAAGLDERLAGLGDVAGVAVLGPLHGRDADAVARRHGVPVHVPAWVDGVDCDAAVETFADGLPGTAFEAIEVSVAGLWREAALHRGDGTLIAQEVLGTADHFVGPGERLGVTPFLRAFPPREALGGLDVERVLVGHGPPVLEDAELALEEALARSRRGLPRQLLVHAETHLRTGYVALLRD